MEAIKKKVQAMKVEKDNATDKVDTMDQANKDAEGRVAKTSEEVDGLKKRLAQLEGEFAVIQVTYNKTTETLENKGKTLVDAELELNRLSKKVQTIEENFEQTEEKLKAATTQLVIVQEQGEDSERNRKLLENRNITDEERMKGLEAQLKEATNRAEEADKNCDEVGQKNAIVEMELEVAEERVAGSEMKILELEEELKVVGNNLRSLEVSEEKARQSELDFKNTIKNLTAKMKQAEARAEFAERTVQKLLKEVDRIEDEVRNEQEKFKAISTELEVTFSEMTGY